MKTELKTKHENKGKAEEEQRPPRLDPEEYESPKVMYGTCHGGGGGTTCCGGQG